MNILVGSSVCRVRHVGFNSDFMGLYSFFLEKFVVRGNASLKAWNSNGKSDQDKGNLA